MDAESDSLLIERAIHGDVTALAALLERHGATVAGELDSEINPRWQSLLSIDDVMQQTYLDAFLGISRFRGSDGDTFRGWLVTQARRNLVDAARMLQAEKRGGSQMRIQPPAADESVTALFDQLSATTTTPSRYVAKDEARSALEHAVGRLPAVYQRVVRMYDLEARDVTEVAATLGRSEGAVYMIRARAHDRLAELLGAASKYFTDSA